MVLLEAVLPLAVATVVAAGLAYGMSVLAILRLAPPGTPLPLPGHVYFVTMGAGLAIALVVIGDAAAAQPDDQARTMSDSSDMRREIEAEARRLFPDAVRRVEWLRHGGAPVIEPGELAPQFVLAEPPGVPGTDVRRMIKAFQGAYGPAVKQFRLELARRWPEIRHLGVTFEDDRGNRSGGMIQALHDDREEHGRARYPGHRPARSGRTGNGGPPDHHGRRAQPRRGSALGAGPRGPG